MVVAQLGLGNQIMPTCYRISSSSSCQTKILGRAKLDATDQTHLTHYQNILKMDLCPLNVRLKDAVTLQMTNPIAPPEDRLLSQFNNQSLTLYAIIK